MVIFNKKWKKYKEIQLTKNIMDLNIRKITNHPPSPERYSSSTLQLFSGIVAVHYSCLAVQQQCITVVQWYSSSTLQLFSGVVAVHYSCLAVQQQYITVVQRYSSSTLQQFSCIVAVQYSCLAVQQQYITVVQRCSSIIINILGV